MILLTADKKQVLDSKGKPHTVYRVFYDHDVKVGDRYIHSGSVGGYAESLENLHNVILQNSAIVLADVQATNCLFRDECLITGGVFRECIVEGRATLHGSINAFNSIFSDSCQLAGSFEIKNSTFERSSYANGHGKIIETTITGGGHIIKGNVDIENCRIEGTSEVIGNTKLRNSHLSGRVVVKDGNLQNQTLNYDYTLNIEQRAGEL